MGQVSHLLFPSTTVRVSTCDTFGNSSYSSGISTRNPIFQLQLRQYMIASTVTSDLVDFSDEKFCHMEVLGQYGRVLNLFKHSCSAKSSTYSEDSILEYGIELINVTACLFFFFFTFFLKPFFNIFFQQIFVKERQCKRQINGRSLGQNNYILFWRPIQTSGSRRTHNIA